MRDVRERSGMHERRRALERLHQLGHDGVLHQDHQRPGDAQISAVTGSPLWLEPITMRPKRALMSARLVVSARIAMISLATVMSKPVTRVAPFSSGLGRR